MSDAISRRATPILSALFFLAMVAGCAGIAYMSADYFRDVPHPFLLEKLPLRHEAAFRIALLSHVAAALFSLPACLLLLSSRLRARFLRAHRWLGRVTGLVVLLALVPSGVVLALTARGGVAGTIGFLLSGLIVAAAMVLAVVRARAGDLAAHRRAARHVVAQLSVAVTSRAMLAGFGLLGEHGDAAYLVALWVPVIAGIVLVEAMERRPGRERVPAWRRPVVLTGAASAAAVAAVLWFHVPTTAMAAGSPSSAAEALVTQHLIEPRRRWLARFGRYSRVAVPTAIAPRITDTTLRRDARGEEFLRFAMDERFGDDAGASWVRDEYTGCVYPGTGEVYVSWGYENGEHYHPSGFFGARVERAPAQACIDVAEAGR